MRLSIISFTSRGAKLSEKIKDILQDNYEVKCFSKKKSYKDIQFVGDSIYSWTKRQFSERNQIIFIGACGIAVRAISGCVKNKLADSAVVVIDEKGQYAIPILSGHYGGANELAIFVAAKLDAIPVITTATDISDLFAVDVFAKKNGLFIGNKYGIAEVSSKVLDGQPITMSIEDDHDMYLEEHSVSIRNTIINIKKFPPKEKVDVVIADKNNKQLKTNTINAALYLYPKKYVLGIGCKKNTSFAKIEEFILEKLDELSIDIEECVAITSIINKKNEKGLVEFSNKHQIPFYTYTADELKKIKGDFEESEFVKKTVGVGNVCETSALFYSKNQGKVVMDKL